MGSAADLFDLCLFIFFYFLLFIFLCIISPLSSFARAGFPSSCAHAVYLHNISKLIVMEY